VPLFDQLHADWQIELQEHRQRIDEIELCLRGKEIEPPYEFVFRALSSSLGSTRVVIFGQDPYPTKGHAHGLAFSVDSKVSPLPASLRNIYRELESDVHARRASGDLSDWSEQGVMLINRVLTTETGQSLTHEKLGWQGVTELKKFFKDENVISSVHPSPLSAYRGFFGSQPFSQVNAKLVAKGFTPITW
jgi:uracil-DNA glycosylase